MLAPIAPDTRDPRYREQLAQYRRDLAAMAACPADWGRRDPRAAVMGVEGSPAPQHQAASSAGPSPAVAPHMPLTAPAPVAGEARRIEQTEPMSHSPPSPAEPPGGSQEAIRIKPGHTRSRNRRRT